MRRQREELDDTIDRVAAGITYVPADPALAARIAERIGSTPDGFTWHVFVAGAVGVATVAIGVALLMNTRQDSIETPLATMTTPAERAPALAKAPPAVTVTASGVGVDPVKPQHAAPRRVTEVAGVAPQIPALALPPLLDVAALPTDTLTIAAVELAPLDVPDLAIAELDGRSEPKE
jgi:hypothetical protein